jgi:hypothetical protein
MSSIAAFFGSSFFFIPFLYFPLYIYIERKFSNEATVQYALKTFTVLAGLFTIIYAVTAPIDFPVLMPGRPGMENHVPASVFLAIVGAATMTLPLYSKHIKFSNKMD